ncbi:tRNA lysidine(34) synthetase TilS [Anaerostipes sp.]|uniref:tRNA lysidine(34) synthetase TilS n=1 Tax=Anaerostipes sp. TaxID=1872530 RepID=UPI0025B8AA06|nr:tRNA lysidine(34) synthetase TilS [Anaerostipes sp.]MBS7006948.1 tRNA lysidine(34) synthetase TilS [Anaerostipes sp.]
MIKQGDFIAVGVSGGADSVCLLLLLCGLRQEYDLTLKAVHVNHSIRKEAGKDQQFVEKLCQKLQVPWITFVEDVKKTAEKKSMSLEEAGRLIRYQCFRKVLKQHGGGKIAVAHHQNDQAETVLYRIARGTGIRGLKGMEPVRGDVIRPLLCLSKSEIISYLKEKNQSWMEDLSNEDNTYARNKIRNQVIPVLTQVNSKAVEHIFSLTEEIEEWNRYLEQLLAKAWSACVKQHERGCGIDLERFLEEPEPVRRLLAKQVIEYAAGKKKDIEKIHVQNLCELAYKETGKSIDLPYGLKAAKTYKELMVETAKVSEEATHMGCLSLTETDGDEKTGQKDFTKIIDYDKIDKDIQLRYRRPGDYLIYSKDGKRKSLNRYFIDEKIPREERDKIPLAADGSRIIWIIGYRLSEMYKVSEETERYLKLEYN